MSGTQDMVTGLLVVLSFFFYEILVRHPYIVLVAVAVYLLWDYVPRPHRLLARARRIAQVRRDLRANPYDAHARSELAELLLHAGRPQEAVQVLHEATRGNGASRTATYLLGCALVAAGRPDEARPALMTTLAEDPKFRYGEAFVRLGDCERARGDWEGAAKAYEAAFAQNGSYAEAAYRLAEARSAGQDVRGARQVLDTMLTTAHTLPRFRLRQERVWLRRIRRLRRRLAHAST